MYYALTLDSIFKLVSPKGSDLGSELTWQTSMLYIVLLILVNETIYLYGNLPFFKIYVNHFMAWDNSPGAILWVLRHFLSLISRLLQHSCLENPTDGGAWWAAVHGVAKSRTRLHFHFSLSCIREGNGNPLQYSCLENPRDEGAWWAAVSGVAQSRTRLKWLSSSSSRDDKIES